jgi:hypothetical protein
LIACCYSYDMCVCCSPCHFRSYIPTCFTQAAILCTWNIGSPVYILNTFPLVYAWLQYLVIVRFIFKPDSLGIVFNYSDHAFTTNNSVIGFRQYRVKPLLPDWAGRPRFSVQSLARARLPIIHSHRGNTTTSRCVLRLSLAPHNFYRLQGSACHRMSGIRLS